MSINDAKLLKLGDYVKCSRPSQSDEYFMVTGIEENFRLRRVGNKELIILESAKELEDFIKINTNRAQ